MADGTSTAINLNPFSKRENFNRSSIVTYKIVTIVAFIFYLLTDVYYSVRRPHEGHHPHRTIWGQNRVHYTPFAINSAIASIYWVVQLILQAGYCYHFWHQDTVYVTAAANVGSHFVAHCLLTAGFVHLFVRSIFWWALLLVIVDFINLSSAYFRHATNPRFIHIPVVSMPLAWQFMSLFWVGAIATNAHSLLARITANIFIWGFLGYGLFFVAIYKDYTMGFSLSVLTAALGVGQFFTKVIALQWEFAFAIMAVLFVLSCAVAFPGLLGGHDPFKRGQVVSEDQERAPLLADE